MRPPSAVLDRLRRLRLFGNAPGRSLRLGERRSTAKGVGLEFVGHRAYRQGDNLRHLDARVYARLRQPFVREYLEDRQLRVSILVDSSASMDFGAPSKAAVAHMLAGMLGYAALVSGDLVDVAVAQGDRINWSDALQGAARAEDLFGWLEVERPGGVLPFPAQLQAALPRLRAANAVLVLSDWWMEHPEQDTECLAALPGRVVALQVTAPEEEDPLALGGGDLRLADAESGGTLDLTMDAARARDYVDLLVRYREALQARLQRIGGELLPLRSDRPADDLLAALVRARLLG